MRISEWMVVAYLGYLMAILPFRRVPRSRRLKLLAFVPAAAALVIGVAFWPISPASRALRTWLPLAYILVCYWLTGFYFVNPQPKYEARFAAFDRQVRRWLGAEDFARRAPRAVLEFLELSYFACYIVVPAGMASYVLAGRQDASDRFWSIVLLAELACYGLLPWVRTRPWWILQPGSPLSRRRVLLRRLNLLIVRETSTHANTFPSGHAAGGVATALAVAMVSPLAGAAFLVVAVCIMAGSVFGEYHYAGDALAGAATGLLAWSVVALLVA